MGPASARVRILPVGERTRWRRTIPAGETGKRKGSWKGGTIGHSIGMEPGELHESAFRRYCTEHNMVFGGEAAWTGRE